MYGYVENSGNSAVRGGAKLHKCRAAIPQLVTIFMTSEGTDTNNSYHRLVVDLNLKNMMHLNN